MALTDLQHPVHNQLPHERSHMIPLDLGHVVATPGLVEYLHLKQTLNQNLNIYEYDSVALNYYININSCNNIGIILSLIKLSFLHLKY